MVDFLQGQRDLENIFSELEEKRRGVSKGFPVTLDRLQQSDEAYNKSIKIVEEQHNRLFDEADQVFSNLETIGRFPPELAQFLGIFMPSLDPDVQDAKLRRIGNEAAKLELKASQAGRIREQTQTAAIREQTFKTQELTFTREGYLDQISLINMGMEIDARVRQKDVQSVQDASTETLQNWLANPKSAPKRLQNMHGLIKSALNDRIAEEQGIQANQLQLDALTRERNLASIPLKDLQAMRAGQKPVPQGLQINDIVNETDRMERMSETMASLRLANKAGEFEFAAVLKGRALTEQMSETELMAAAQKLQESGQDTISLNILGNNIEFTSQEIMSGLAARSQSNRELRNLAAERAIQQTAIASELNSIEGQVGAMSAVSPNRDLEDAVDLGFSKITGAIEIGSPDIAVKEVTRLRELVEAKRKELIDAQPKENQLAVREHIESRGFVTTPQASSSYLVNNAFDPAAMGTNPYFSQGWNVYANELQKQIDTQMGSSQFTITSDENGVPIMTDTKGRKVQANDLVEDAIQASGVRDVVANNMFQDLLLQSIRDLQAKTTDSQGRSVWDGIVSPDTGYFGGDIVADGTFSLGSFYQILGQKTLSARVDGSISGTDDMFNILAKQVESRYEQLRYSGVQSVAEAAFMEALFHNKPDVAVDGLVNDMRANAPEILRQVETTTQAVKELTVGQMIAPMVGAAMGGNMFIPPSEGGGLEAFTRSLGGDMGRGGQSTVDAVGPAGSNLTQPDQRGVLERHPFFGWMQDRQKKRLEQELLLRQGGR